MSKYMNEQERYTLERLLKKKVKPEEIAHILDKSIRTIYREIKRGTITLMNSDLVEYREYCADFAQADFEEKQKNKGPHHKILQDNELCTLIQRGILEEERSPDDIIGRLKRDNPEKNYPCTKTVYNTIDQGLLPGVTNKNLLVKQYKKTRKTHTIKRKYPVSKLRSIEDRSINILKRDEYGHWEMDCIESQKGDATTLLVLTERLTRFSIVFVMPAHTQDMVKYFLDKLERKYRSKFKKIFKTITMDHGHEFLNPDAIEQSLYTKKKRTTTFYCHPHCPSERGSNENWNKQVRRFIKKGVKIANLSLHFIQDSVTKINNLHRKILNYQTSEELFNYHMSLI